MLLTKNCRNRQKSVRIFPGVRYQHTLGDTYKKVLGSFQTKMTSFEVIDEKLPKRAKTA